MKPLYGKAVNLILDAEKEIFNEREDLFVEKNVIFFLTRCATTPCPCIVIDRYNRRRSNLVK